MVFIRIEKSRLYLLEYFLVLKRKYFFICYMNRIGGYNVKWYKLEIENLFFIFI